ncbi:MAG: hypothetical protein U1E65_17685 [Myxococcota bacterium]
MKKAAAERAALAQRLLRHRTQVYAQRLIQAGHRAIAATGSLGRGDAEAGADIDLWVVGPLDQVLQDEIDGTPVTVMFERPERVADFNHLCFIEVDDIWILHDPDRTLAAIQRRYRRLRPRIRQEIVDATVVEIFGLLRQSRRGAPALALHNLREAALCIASLEVFLASGKRTPKLRHFRQTLAPQRARLLQRILGLDGLNPALLRAAAQRLPLDIDRFLGLRPGTTGPADGALALLQADRVEEGLMKLRKYWLDAVVVPLGDRWAAGDGPRQLSPALRRGWRIAQTTVGRDEAAVLEKARRALSRFIEGSPAKSLLGPGWFTRPV